MISYILSTIRASGLDVAYRSRIGYGALTGVNAIRGIARNENLYNILRWIAGPMYEVGLGSRLGNKGALVGCRSIIYLGGKDTRAEVKPVAAGAPPAPSMPSRAIIDFMGSDIDFVESIEESGDIGALELYPARYGGAVTSRLNIRPSGRLSEILHNDDFLAYRTKTGNTSAFDLRRTFDERDFLDEPYREFPGMNLRKQQEPVCV